MLDKKVHLVTLAAAGLLTAAIAAPQIGPPSRPDVPQDDRAVVRELIKELGARRLSYGDPSPERLIGQAEPVVPAPPRWQPMIRDVEAARTKTLEARAARRAYDGAPPVIAHTRNFTQTKTCLDCHREGIWLGERFGPPLSHPELINCTQCHVESQNAELRVNYDPAVNAFEGRTAPHGGTVAWTGAPPVMPHTTMMRSRCLSCHGPESYPGLRTDHPARLNCTQCHAPAASLDQMSPFFTGNATLLEPPIIEMPALPEIPGPPEPPETPDP